MAKENGDETHQLVDWNSRRLYKRLYMNNAEKDSAKNCCLVPTKNKMAKTKPVGKNWSPTKMYRYARVSFLSEKSPVSDFFMLVL